LVRRDLGIENARDLNGATVYVQTYLFVAAIYFAICFGIWHYSQWLERRRAS
jgi:ABC-type amino acid transport system permease subunit